MPTYPIPQIVYNAGAGAVTLTFTLPCPPYYYESTGYGGNDKSASGIPEAFQIRRDQLLYWTLIFSEAEWAAVETWLNWAQRSGGSFTIAPSKAAPGTTYTVYLEKPAMNEPVRAARVPGYVAGFKLDLVFRSTTSTRFDSPIV